MKIKYFILILVLSMCACKKDASNTKTSSEVDVYVTGFEYNGSVYVAKYWKNGQAVALGVGSIYDEVTSIFVSGNDVYVAGYEENTAGASDYVAKYWKNGNPVILAGASKYSEATSIFLVKK